MPDDGCCLVVQTVVLVVVGAVETFVVIRSVEVGVELCPQMQAAALLQLQEAGGGHAEPAGDIAIVALLKDCAALGVPELPDAIGIVLFHVLRGTEGLLVRGCEGTAVDVDGLVFLHAVGVILAGGVGELEEDLPRVGGAVVEHGAVYVQIRDAVRHMIQSCLKPAEGELGPLLHGQQVQTAVEGVLVDVIRVLLYRQPEDRSGGQVLVQGQALEGQVEGLAGGEGLVEIPLGDHLAAGCQLDLCRVFLAGADGRGAGVGEADLADQSAARGEIADVKTKIALAQGLLPGAEGDGVEAHSGAVGGDQSFVGSVAAAHVEGGLLQLEEAALREHQQPVLGGFLVHMDRADGHLEIGEGELVQIAAAAAGGLHPVDAQIDLFQIRGVDIVGDGVLVDLQIPHGQDRRRAPGLFPLIPPCNVDGVGEAVGHGGGIDRRHVGAVGADGDLGACGLGEDGPQRCGLPGCRGFEVGLGDQVAVAVHLKQSQGLRPVPVDPGFEEAEVGEVGISLGLDQGGFRVDAVLELCLGQVAVGAAVEVHDGLEQHGLAEAAAVQGEEPELMDQAQFRILVDPVEADGEGGPPGRVEVFGIGGGVEHVGLAVQGDGFQVFDLAVDRDGFAGPGFQDRPVAVELVHDRLGGPVEDRVGQGRLADGEVLRHRIGIRQHILVKALLRGDEPLLELGVGLRTGAESLGPEDVAACHRRQADGAAGGLQRLHGAGSPRGQIDLPGFELPGGAAAIGVGDPAHGKLVCASAEGKFQIRETVVVQQQPALAVLRIERMDQAGAVGGQIPGHHQAAEHQLRLVVQHQRVGNIYLVSRLGQLVGVSGGQVSGQLLGVAGGAVAGELEVVCGGGIEGTGLGIGRRIDPLLGGDVRGPGDMDQAFAGTAARPGRCRIGGLLASRGAVAVKPRPGGPGGDGDRRVRYTVCAGGDPGGGFRVGVCLAVGIPDVDLALEVQVDLRL